MAGASLPAPRTLNQALSPGAAGAILHALAVQPADRFQKVEDFAAALSSQPVMPAPMPEITPLKLPRVLTRTEYLRVMREPIPEMTPPPPVISAPYSPAASIPPAATVEEKAWRWLILLFFVSILVIFGVLVTNSMSAQPTMAPPAPPTTAPPAMPTEAPAAMPTTAPAAPQTEVSVKDGMTLLYVPAGKFFMGSTDSDSQALPNEKPQHTVDLDAFWIDQTEVTNTMYKRCVQAGLCQAPSDAAFYADAQFGNYPVVYVNWNDAQAYCRWAGRQLPTEAQWEKAARGADGRLYPWGEGIGCDKANYAGCKGKAIAVGSYPSGASPYGALDMAGNVWEWVADWFGENYYASSPSSNPTGPASGQYPVMRGGSWSSEAQYLRAAFRSWDHPRYRNDNYGFRCSR